MNYPPGMLYHNIDILSKPSILYCIADVQYNGRARSTLATGRYLIIRKNDNSIAVHGGLCNKPCNYINKCTSSMVDGNTLTFSNRNESICIVIHQIVNELILTEWSESKPNITRTEKELVLKLLSKWDELIGVECAIELEFKTNFGQIDILGISKNNIHHVIEVKRKTVTVSNCYQVRRYLECLNNVECIGYLASPSINKKAEAALADFGLRWIQIDFD